MAEVIQWIIDNRELLTPTVIAFLVAVTGILRLAQRGYALIRVLDYVLSVIESLSDAKTKAAVKKAVAEGEGFLGGEEHKALLKSVAAVDEKKATPSVASRLVL